MKFVNCLHVNDDVSGYNNAIIPLYKSIYYYISNGKQNNFK